MLAERLALAAKGARRVGKAKVQGRSVGTESGGDSGDGDGGERVAGWGGKPQRSLHEIWGAFPDDLSNNSSDRSTCKPRRAGLSPRLEPDSRESGGGGAECADGGWSGERWGGGGAQPRGQLGYGPRARHTD